MFAHYQVPVILAVTRAEVRASLHVSHTSLFLLTQLKATSTNVKVRTLHIGVIWDLR